MRINSIYCLRSSVLSIILQSILPYKADTNNWTRINLTTYRNSTIQPYTSPITKYSNLLASGVAVTWAHHGLLENNDTQATRGLFFTVLLGLYIYIFHYITSTYMNILKHNLQLQIQHSAWSEKYLTLYVQFWAPDDGRQTRLKHVERLTEINKLRNVTFCWLYSENRLRISWLPQSLFVQCLAVFRSISCQNLRVFRFS